MRTTRMRAALAASLAIGLLAGACGDDDDTDTDETTTTEASSDGPTAMEVTLTADGIEGLPAEVPAGLVEVTLVNETEGYGSLDITRVAAGTTEDEFVEGMGSVMDGGEFPDFFESNAGVSANAGETATSMIVLKEGEHIAWTELFEGGSEGEGEDDGEDGGEEAPEEETTSTTAAGEGDTTTTTAAAEEPTTTTTTAATTTTGAEEQGAADLSAPQGTLTAVGSEGEDEPDTTETTVPEDDGATEDTADDAGSGEDAGNRMATEPLTVTAGDDDAELPEADGEIVARDYEFEATLEAGTINFRNEGPQQFHHAVVMDFGTNDPAEVEEVFPALLAAEGEGTAEPDTGDLDMEQVNFDFGGSGVFGPDQGAGTFEADIVDGNTYVLVCFIQDRTGGPPHAVAYDMWEVVQAGGGGTTTTEG